MPTLRVVSWNVRSLRDGRAGVVAVLLGLQPDVVIVQEAPRLVLWRTSRWWLARVAGLRVATRGRAAGNLILVRPGLTVSHSYDVPFPLPGGSRPRGRPLHRRAVAVAEIRVQDGILIVAGTHLDLDPTARLASARRVRAAIGAGPLVLGADVNELPGEPAWSVLGEGLVDARDGLGPTFPAWAPQRHIDALFVSPPVRVTGCRVVDTGRASDHLALLAEVTVTAVNSGE